MSRRRRGQAPKAAAAPTPPTVDLRAAARALLAGEHGAGMALLPEALARIRAIAMADAPILAPLAGEAEAVAIGRRQSSNVRGGVAVIPLQGIITPQGSFLERLFGAGGGGLRGFSAALAEALGDDDVDAIVLDVHSPGGLIGLVPETAAEVRAARGVKPITAVANTMAGSAAYWLAAQADEVVVTPSGFAGSIGVYLVHDDWSGFNEAMGVLPTYISAGKYKVEGHPDAPLDDEARAALQREVDDLYSLFVNDVAAGRGASAAEVRSGFGEGRVLPAARAVEARLADRVATIDDVIRGLAGGGSSRGRARALPPAPEPSSALPPTPVNAEVQARLAELRTLAPPTAI